MSGEMNHGKKSPGTGCGARRNSVTGLNLCGILPFESPKPAQKTTKLILEISEEIYSVYERAACIASNFSKKPVTVKEIVISQLSNRRVEDTVSEFLEGRVSKQK